MPQLALYLLGPPHLKLDGKPVHIGRKKALALLAYLTVTPGSRSADGSASVHRRDTLANLLWPEYDQRSARAHLRRALVSLTNRLGGEWFIADRETIGLNPDVGLWLDMDQFRQRLAACEAHGHGMSQACPDCLATLTEATELHREDFISGFSLPDSLPFDEWQRHQTQRLREDLGRVLQRLSVCHAANGDHELAVAAAQRWLDLDPLRESPHRTLMEFYAQAGRGGAALRQYRQCVRALEAELGVPPSAETTALYERIRTERMRPTDDVSREPAARLPAFLGPHTRSMAVASEIFVGRERQLEVLSAHLESALAGQSRVVFVTGGPGRGKTALAGRFVRQALAAYPDLLAARGTCNAHSGAGDPFLPFREALGILTGDVEAAWAAGAISQDQARRLWGFIPLAVQTLLDHGPYLINTLLPGPALLRRAKAAAEETPAWLEELRGWVGREHSGPSGLEQSAIFEQFTNVLRALAENRPLLLILDDLQWADSGSIDLLFHLGRRLADVGGRILIVGAFRPEEVSAGRHGGRHPLDPALDELQRRFGNVGVDLAQADDVDGRLFVDAYLDAEPNRLGEGFRDALFQHTGGHALFTTELLRAMQDRGDLVQETNAGGAWVEGPVLDWETLPARVEAVIRARVARLDEQQRELLTVASVEGERFTAQVLALVLDLTERDILRMLSQPLGPHHHRLVREEAELQVPGTRRYLSRYRFAHALFQEYLYHDLSAGERRLLHGEVALALEEAYADQSDEIAAELAHHYGEAGCREKAIEYALRAGHKARATYANQEAIFFYERALELLPPLDLQASPPLGPFVTCGETETAGKEEGACRLEALNGLGQVNFALGDTAVAEGYLREAIALGQAMELAPRELARLSQWLNEVLYVQGRYKDIIRIAEQGLALLDANAAEGEAAECVEAALMFHDLAASFYGIGNPETAYGFRERCVQLVQHLPYSEEFPQLYWTLIEYYKYDRKNIKQAEGWIKFIHQHALRRHDLRALVDAYIHGGWILLEQGNCRGANLQLQKSLELAIKIGDARGLLWNHFITAWAGLTLGDLCAVQEHAERLLKIADSAAQLFSTHAYGYLGVVDLCNGVTENAASAFQKFALASDERNTVMALLMLGRTQLLQGQSREALKTFQEALTLAPPTAYPHAHYRWPLADVLSGLEEACEDRWDFLAYCLRLREERPEIEDSGFATWYLTPESCYAFPHRLANDGFVDSFSPEWVWHDPVGDCSFRLQNSLHIHAANGRDLWHINLSAPRLLRPAPVGNFAAQTKCGPVSDTKPAIGGLLLRKDKENYLRLSRGMRGECEISLEGCVSNRDVVFGRGRLPLDSADPIFLRMERIGDHVNALCSADGEEWFTVGSVTFPSAGPLQIGLHAIGQIDRTIYPGAYPDGTAMRFESFTLLGR